MSTRDRLPGARSAAALVVLALVAAGCSGRASVAVELAEVTAGEVVETVAAPAQVEPAARHTVVATTPGEVVVLYVEDGASVAAGEPVLRVASEPVELAVAQAEAAVAAAEALAGVGPAVDLSPLLAAQRRQLDEVVPALLDGLAAQAEALPDGDASAAALERIAEARERYQAARRELVRAEQEARGAAQRSTAAQRAAAEAQQAQAEAALGAAMAQEGALLVRAPIAGTVEFAGGLDGGDIGSLLGGGVPSSRLGAGAAAIVVGTRVVPGQPLFTVYDLSGFHVLASVDEVDAVEVEAGQRAAVVVDAYPEQVFAGSVRRVAVGPVAGPVGGVSYATLVDLDEPPPRLRVGMTASVEIEVRRVESDTIVPSRALLRRGGREVLLVVQGNVVREVAVRVVAAGEDVAAVEGDLALGDRVVVRGAERLHDGDRLP